MEDFHAVRLARRPLDEFRTEELDVAAVLEIELEMPGIQAKLPECTANVTGRCIVRGRPSPALIPSFVFKLQETAVGKEHGRFIELRVGNVAG